MRERLQAWAWWLCLRLRRGRGLSGTCHAPARGPLGHSEHLPQTLHGALLQVTCATPNASAERWGAQTLLQT